MEDRRKRNSAIHSACQRVGSTDTDRIEVSKYGDVHWAPALRASASGNNKPTLYMIM